MGSSASRLCVCVCVCVCVFLILLTVYAFDRNELAEDLWVDDGGWVD